MQVGWPKAKELLLTARVVEAQESLNIGLLNHLVDSSELMKKSRELAELIVELSGSHSAILDGPPTGADIHVRSPCVDLARELLGFEASVGLKEGLLRTIERARLAT